MIQGSDCAVVGIKYWGHATHVVTLQSCACSCHVVHNIYQLFPHHRIYKYIKESGGHNTALCCTTFRDKSLTMVFPALCYTTLVIPIEFEDAQNIRIHTIPLQNVVPYWRYRKLSASQEIWNSVSSVPSSTAVVVVLLQYMLYSCPSGLESREEHRGNSPC